MVLPPQSLGLSPIEQIWDIVKSQIEASQRATKQTILKKEKKKRSEQQVENVWQLDTPELALRYIATVRDGFKAVILAKGEYTRY